MGAREIWGILAEQILEISDDVSSDYTELEDGRKVIDHEAIQRSRLRVDTRKWLASKLYPKRYGDRVDVDHTSKGESIIPTINVMPPSNGDQP